MQQAEIIKVTGPGPSFQGLGAQGLGPGPGGALQDLWAKAIPISFLVVEGWETAETAAAIGLGGKRARDTPPTPPPPPRPPRISRLVREKRRGFTLSVTETIQHALQGWRIVSSVSHVPLMCSTWRLTWKGSEKRWHPAALCILKRARAMSQYVKSTMAAQSKAHFARSQNISRGALLRTPEVRQIYAYLQPYAADRCSGRGFRTSPSHVPRGEQGKVDTTCFCKLRPFFCAGHRGPHGLFDRPRKVLSCELQLLVGSCSEQNPRQGQRLPWHITTCSVVQDAGTWR